MLLKNLVLTDIGTYAGQQKFDLVPKTKYGSKRSIVLFGGLNGAGKTTFLTAIRLALYGRQSLDVAPTDKEYDQYLLDLIHRPRHFLVKPSQASVSLEFEYSRMGERSTYTVVRFWEERGKSVEKRLVIYRDGGTDPFLADEQAQAFLSQLVPPGVAQFFFFDGEKISELAKDDSDVVLADAIRRLLGLDLVERLNSDLNVFTRSHRASFGDKKLRDEVVRLEAELKSAEDAYEAAEKSTAVINEQRTTANLAYEAKKSELSMQGGAWSVNRNSLDAELDRLGEQRTQQEESLRESLNGVGIFSLAPKAIARVTHSLKAEGLKLEGSVVKLAVSERANALEKALLASVSSLDKANLQKALDAWIDGFNDGHADVQSLHGLSAADIRSVRELLDNVCQSERRKMIADYRLAKQSLSQEEGIQSQLAHAPSDESIKTAFDEMTNAAQKVGELNAKWLAAVEEQRRLTWFCIELVRKLKKCEEKQVGADNAERGHVAADAAQNMIAEFRGAAAQHKCELLRNYFVLAFKRLARKDDIVRDAKIDAETFKVTLLDEAGRVVAKKRLSAGEKQIYSIAMLEALAKTSGRNLPVIIDTPLGRLDSKHRAKLVESYFPVASHQVIVLSTDTEVDGTFYDALSNKISHAFHLSYDQESGSTEVKPGYFWRNTNEELANAA